MRKLITIIALVLTVALCASFAASAETLTSLTSTSKDVTITYNSNTPDTSVVVYSVDVTWTDVAFTYNAGTTVWNPSTHEYDAPGASASWADGEGSVKVTNHSNAAVKVTVSFITANNGSADVAVSNGTFTLATAVDTAKASAPTNTATLTASGAPVSNAKLGTVKVAIAQA